MTTGALLALAADVPRRLRRGLVLWLLFLGALACMLVVVVGIGTEPYPLAASHGARVTMLWGFEAHKSPSTPQPQLLLEVLGYTLVVLWGSLFGTASVIVTSDVIARAFVPGAAEVTLTKPVSRNEVIAGRALGAFLVIAGFQVLIVVAGAAIAGVRTGHPTAQLALALPFLLLALLVLHGLATLAAVVLRNQLFGVFGAAAATVASILVVTAHGFAQLQGEPGVALEPRLEVLARGVRAVTPRLVDLVILAHMSATGQRVSLSHDLPILANGLAWLFLSYGLTAVVLRKRDL